MGEKYKDHTGMYGMPARQVKLNPKGAVPPDFLDVYTNCSEDDVSKEHYATFPQRLIAPLIKAGCPKDGIIIDPFAGVMTTAIVAKKLQRQWVMIDLSPKYCEIGKKRLDFVPEPMIDLFGDKKQPISKREQERGWQSAQSNLF